MALETSETHSPTFK